MSESIGEFVEIERLVPWADNPRENDVAVDAVARSIERFGFASPIIARRENNEIVAGHTRYKAAQKLSLRHVPVVFVDLDPVDSHLLALADNKIGEQAKWDTESLADILRSLSDLGADLEDAGFSDEDLKLDDSLPDDLSESLQTEYRIEIELESEGDQKKIFDELNERGFKCRVLTL